MSINPPPPDEELRVLRRLVALAGPLNAELNLTALLNLVLDTAIEATGAERGLVIHVDANQQARVQSARNFGGTQAEERDLAYSRTVVQEVVKTGRPRTSADAMDDAGLAGIVSVQKLGVRSLLCVPFRIKDRVVGAICLDHREKAEAFTPLHLSAVTALGDQAAVAIGNAALFERLSQSIVQLNTRVRRLEEEVKKKPAFAAILGESESLLGALKTAGRVATSTAPVLILGETGTGKELVARAVHDSSKRAEGPFVPVNCAAIPADLVASALFGHVKGAFTGASSDHSGYFEQADGGTIFLDEVGDLPPDVQAALLRALGNGEVQKLGARKTQKVDARLVAATNRPLDRMVQEGKFREDLKARLEVVTIALPPLRERRGDIPILLDAFVKRIGEECDKPGLSIDAEARRVLENHDYPQNVRELENAVRAAVAYCEGTTITLEYLPPKFREAAKDVRIRVPRTNDELKEALGRAQADIEKAFIVEALRRAAGNASKAATETGMNRALMQRKMKEYGVSSRDFRRPGEAVPEGEEE